MPELTAQIDIPAFVYFEYLETVGLNAENISFPVNLEVYELGGESWPWCRGIVTTHRGKKALKLSGKSFLLEGKQATKELKIRFKHVGECLSDVDIPGGEYIDPEIPWLFRCVDGKWLYHGAASQSVKDNEALVYVPAVCDFSGQDESTEVVGKLFDGTLVKLSGVMYCHHDDSKYRLSSGQEESVIQFSLDGKKCPFPSNPKGLYLGMPYLVERNIDSGSVSRRHNAKLEAKKIGTNEAWKQLSPLVEPGCYEIKRTDKEGNTQLRKRVGILAKDFRVDIKPDQKQVKSGVISLKGCAGLAVGVKEEQVRAEVPSVGEGQDIRLKAEKEPPITIDVSLLPPGQNKTITLTLPYPSKGAFAV